MDSRRIRMGGVLVAVLALAGSSVACSQPVAEEAKGHTTAKLLAPRPLVKAKSSPTTQEREGITEWRIFRGRNDVVLSGYGKNGKVVKGVTIGFRRDGDGPIMRARLLDGSLFAARHEYLARRTVVNQQVEKPTASFLYAALADMRALNRAVAKTSTSSSQSIRVQTFDPGDFLGCGSGLLDVLTNALECLKSSGGSSAAIAQCIAAAESAAGIGGACGDVPNVPFDPTGAGFDPYADPFGVGGLGDPYGAGDPWGGAGGPYGPDDPFGVGDPWGGAGGPYGPDDPFGAGDPWGGAGGPYGPGDPWGGAGGPYGPGDPWGDPWGAGGMDGWGDEWGVGDWGAGDWGPFDPGLGGLGGLGPDWGDDPFGDGLGCPSCAGPGMGDICADPFTGDVGYPGDFGSDAFDAWGAGF